MIEAVPKGLFSSDFRLCRQDRVLIELDVSSWRERAELAVEGVQYRFYREGLLSGAFLLEREGEALARALKLSAFRNRFELHLAGNIYTLRNLSIWSRRFGLFQGEQQVGSIQPAGVFTRRAVIELPSEWPAAAQPFVFWLALVIWNREAAAAAS